MQARWFCARWYQLGRISKDRPRVAGHAGLCGVGGRVPLYCTAGLAASRGRWRLLHCQKAPSMVRDALSSAADRPQERSPCPPSSVGSHTRPPASQTGPGPPAGTPLQHTQGRRGAASVRPRSQPVGAIGSWVAGCLGPAKPYPRPEQLFRPAAAQRQAAAGRSTWPWDSSANPLLPRSSCWWLAAHGLQPPVRHTEMGANSPTKSHIWLSPCFSATSCRCLSFWKLSFSRDSTSSMAYSASPAAAGMPKKGRGSRLW